jgi:uroporphyrinogen decarboxylase
MAGTREARPAGGWMDARERFLETMRYGTPDHASYWEDPFWYDSTLERWRREGLGPDEHPRDVFSIDARPDVPLDWSVIPKYPRVVLESAPEYKIVRNSVGVTMKMIRDLKPPAMPMFVDFPVHDRAEFYDHLRRLDGDTPERVPADWKALAEGYARRDAPLGIHVGGFFGWMRDWMGLEGLSLALHDDPGMVREGMDHIADFVIKVIRRVLPDVKPDYAWFWEDMAFKTASLMDPKLVKSLMASNYRKIVDVLQSYGIDIIMLDSDGNIEELIPIWLDCGINCLFPMEVAAGMDVVSLRKRYGRELRMVGGVDKREVAKGREAIDREIARIAPVVADGGYIPSIDHAIPPDISYPDFTYYRRQVERISRNGGK